MTTELTNDLGPILYALGGAAGWWLAWSYDPTRLRWLTLVAAIVYTLPAVLRLAVFIVRAMT